MTELDAESNWNGYGAIDAGQIVQAYALDTDASVVDVYIPAKSLHVKDRSKVVIGMQYDFEGEHHYKILNPKLSDDGVYIHAKVYARDYSDICFAHSTCSSPFHNSYNPAGCSQSAAERF